MSIEIVQEIFFAVKGASDNYNGNQEELHVLVNRLRTLEGPLLQIKAGSVSIETDGLETLFEVRL